MKSEIFFSERPSKNQGEKVLADVDQAAVVACPVKALTRVMTSQLTAHICVTCVVLPPLLICVYKHYLVLLYLDQNEHRPLGSKSSALPTDVLSEFAS